MDQEWIPETAPFSINEFSLLLALSPNSQVFPTPQKPTLLNSHLIRNGKNKSVDTCATSKPLFIVFMVHLCLPNRNPFVQFYPLTEVVTDLCQFCTLNSNIQLNVWNVADFDFFSLQSEDNEALIFSKIISLASMLSCISYISLLSLKKKHFLICKIGLWAIYHPLLRIHNDFLLLNLALHIADEVWVMRVKHSFLSQILIWVLEFAILKFLCRSWWKTFL